MPEINFEYDEDKGLNVSIETEQLYLNSVTPKQLESYKNLFGGEIDMAKFADGNIWSTEKTTTRFNTWVNRWRANDPFSALAVSKKDVDETMGNVVLGYGDEPGSSELAFAFSTKHCGKGYGKEAVTAIIKDYAPELVEKGYKLEGKEFISITATSRLDNEASVKILKAAGMRSIREEVKFGHNRYCFFISTAELIEVKKAPKKEEIIQNQQSDLSSGSVLNFGHGK